MENGKDASRFKRKSIIIFSILGFFAITGVAILLIAFYRGSFGITKPDWLSAIFAWISALSAIFIGLVAYLQNERFKIESDNNIKRNMEASEKYNDELSKINSRLLQLEENKEKVYIMFSQDIVKIINVGIGYHIKSNTYGAIFSNDHETDENNAGIFFCDLVNLTKIPIRSIHFDRFEIGYQEFPDGGVGCNGRLVSKCNGSGYIPSPIADDKNLIHCMFRIPGIRDIVNNMCEEDEISIRAALTTESIFGVETKQKYWLRLQRDNQFFKAKDPFSLYLYGMEWPDDEKHKGWY